MTGRPLAPLGASAHQQRVQRRDTYKSPPRHVIAETVAERTPDISVLADGAGMAPPRLCDQCTAHQTLVLRVLSAGPVSVEDDRLDRRGEQEARELFAIRKFLLEQEYPPLCSDCSKLVDRVAQLELRRSRSYLMHARFVAQRAGLVDGRPRRVTLHAPAGIAAALVAALAAAHAAAGAFNGKVLERDYRVALLIRAAVLGAIAVALAAASAGRWGLGLRMWRLLQRYTGLAHRDRFVVDPFDEPDSWLARQCGTRREKHAAAPLGLEFFYYLHCEVPGAVAGAGERAWASAGDSMEVDDVSLPVSQENLAHGGSVGALEAAFAPLRLGDAAPHRGPAAPQLGAAAPHLRPAVPRSSADALLSQNLYGVYKRLVASVHAKQSRLCVGAGATAALSAAAAAWALWRPAALFPAWAGVSALGVALQDATVSGPLLAVALFVVFTVDQHFRVKALARGLSALETLLGRTALAASAPATGSLWALVAMRWYQQYWLLVYSRLLVVLAALAGVMAVYFGHSAPAWVLLLVVSLRFWLFLIRFGH